MTKVIIASKNPVKMKATELAFSKVFPGKNHTFEGVNAPSEVSDQPMSEKETLLGATNRIRNAKDMFPDADYWVGIEGGLNENSEGDLEAFAWMVIMNQTGTVGKGRTASFFLPAKVAQLIHEGKELGEADDIVFNRNNSKYQDGAVGILTTGLITRTTYYEPAIIMALIPFLNKELY